MVVERLRRDVGFIGPADRVAAIVDRQLAEELEIPQRLEDPPKLEEIRQIDIGREAVGEAQMHPIAIEWLGFNQCRR